jgi:hypothetical protein
MIQRVDPTAKLLEGKFKLIGSTFQPSLFIVDYVWWEENIFEILEWMDKCLPKGRTHQKGMIIEFDNDRDRMSFLLRWS